MTVANEIHETTVANSLIFLNRAISEITSHQDHDDAPLTTDIATIAVALLQISFELSLIAYSIRKKGLVSILQDKDKDLSDDLVRERFVRNELKTRTFSQIIKELQDDQSLFDEDDWYHIETFQNLRNKLVHIGFNFYLGDLYDLKYDVIYFLSHPLLKLISLSSDFETPGQVIENHIDPDLYKRLVAFPPYVYQMQRLAAQNSSTLKCLVCGNRALSLDEGICYVCGEEYECDEFVHCGKCGARSAVIYDHLNIKLNNNRMRGLCLECGEHSMVYRCPKCGAAHTLESSKDVDRCVPNRCAFFDCDK